MTTNFKELTSVEALRQECDSLLAQVKFQQKAQAQCRKNTLMEIRDRLYYYQCPFTNETKRIPVSVSLEEFDSVVEQML